MYISELPLQIIDEKRILFPLMVSLKESTRLALMIVLTNAPQPNIDGIDSLEAVFLFFLLR